MFVSGRVLVVGLLVRGMLVFGMLVFGMLVLNASDESSTLAGLVRVAQVLWDNPYCLTLLVVFNLVTLFALVAFYAVAFHRGGGSLWKWICEGAEKETAREEQLWMKADQRKAQQLTARTQQLRKRAAAAKAAEASRAVAAAAARATATNKAAQLTAKAAARAQKAAVAEAATAAKAKAAANKFAAEKIAHTAPAAVASRAFAEAGGAEEQAPKLVAVARGYGAKDAAAKAKETGNAGPIAATDDDEALCVVCLTEERAFILVPCGHRCLCQACARSQSSACPLCMTPAREVIRAYL